MKSNRMHKRTSIIDKTDKLDRGEILDLLGGMIRDAAVKVGAARIRDVKTFKARLDALKTLSYSFSIYKTILSDEQLDDIIQRITAIEEGHIK